jgi:two-component system, OmpR family, aerobic respiration control sensor histidine kinase ArcB
MRIQPPPPTVRTDEVGRERAMLAHDMRGALNGVIGGVASIDFKGVEPKLRVQLERICAGAEHLTFLLEEAFRDGGEAEAEVTNFADFRERLVRRWTGEAAVRGLQLVVENGPGLPRVLHVRPVDLVRVASNLLSNALKFTRAGTVALTFRRATDGALELSVLDEGPGLRGREAGDVCAFGFRDGENAGDGIGLHIVASLVGRMGAELLLRDRTGGGLAAVLRLPAQVCDGEVAADDVQDAPDLAGVRVLLAEDNLTNQLVASQMLTSLGAHVVLASDGVEAIARFEETDIDLVLVDIEMPRMSGLDVIRRIRARRDRRARTPIIALTAYALREHKLQIAEAGADGLISKPVTSTFGFGAAILQHLPALGSAAEAAKDEAAPAPVIDMEVYQSLVDTIGADMLTELLDRIILDLHDAGVNLEAASEPLDHSALRATSHILISVAGAFGAARLRRRAAELNAAANAGSPLCAAAVRACLDELASALAFARTKRSQC